MSDSSQAEAQLDLFKSIPLFSWLTESQFKWLADQSTGKVYQQGDVIFNEGTPSDTLFLIAEGEVKFSCPPQTRTLGPGDYFGELSILAPDLHRSQATATVDTFLFEIKNDSIAALAREAPDQHAQLLTNLARELARRIRFHNTESQQPQEDAP